MPEFKYTARDTSGQMVSGTLTAANRREAAAALAGRDGLPCWRSMMRGRGIGVGAGLPRVPAAMLAMAYSQMSDLLHSGVPLLRSIEVVQRQTSHAGLKAILGGDPPPRGRRQHAGRRHGRFDNVLGEMAVSMVRAGGEGGFLEEALARVAQFTETQDDLKKRTMGAIAYPALLAVVGTIIVVVLVVFFVPKFAELFGRCGKKTKCPRLRNGC